MQGVRVPRETPAGWQIHAPAKLNVYLDVLPKRPDGYHGVRTLLCPVRLSDTLTLIPMPDSPGKVTLRVRSALPLGYSAAVPEDESNLVARALRAAWGRRGVVAGCEVVIDKRIPSEAGLGGGSSDAAAALIAANHLWNLRLTPAELGEIAAGIGSDVPGLLSGGAAICEGRGEVVTPAPVPAGLPCVIAKPRTGLSTASVFERFRPAGLAESTGRLTRLLAALRRGRWHEYPALLLNKLEPAAQSLSEDLRRLANAFAEMPFVASQMSGSGSAYFGLCRTHAQAAHAAASLRARHAAWAVATCTA